MGVATEASGKELEYHLNLTQQAGLLDVAGVTLGGGYYIPAAERHARHVK
jgi:hypothetical protein